MKKTKQNVYYLLNNILTITEENQIVINIEYNATEHRNNWL
jgi:hypothetical protein